MQIAGHFKTSQIYGFNIDKLLITKKDLMPYYLLYINLNLNNTIVKKV